MTKPVSLSQQIEEVEEEIRMRESVYPRQVNKGSMRQSVADFKLARMKAALATLKWVKRHEAVIKAAVVKTEMAR